MNFQESILKTLDRLVKVPSTSGTEEENYCAEEIINVLKEIPYFKENPQNLKFINIEEDPLKRKVVSAFLEKDSHSKEAVILTGHYDVVDISEFGALKPYAFNYKECTEKINQLSLNSEAEADLKSGDYIFGRGTADMKYGLSLYIEIIRYLSEEEDFKGNVLFLAVPGEETNSEGMIRAAKYLKELQKQGYIFKGLFLSECSIPEYKGDENKKIYLGTCGKIMPLFLFAGKESHVCEPFLGFNANLLASELNNLLEGNCKFSDNNRGERTPVPVCLFQRDLRENYSVQVPLYAAAYYNVMTLKKTPGEILMNLKELCHEAFNNAIEKYNSNYKEYYGNDIQQKIQPSILTYSELYEEAYSIYKDKLKAMIKNKAQSLKEKKLSIQDSSVELLKYLYDLIPNKRPAIIISFMPPYYPHKHIEESHGQEFMEVISQGLHYTLKELKTEIKIKEYFMGICDLSYTGAEAGDLKAFNENLVAKGENYYFDIDALNKINIPSVVFGGYGKDFHKYTERLNLSYSLDIVPNTYIYMLKKLFKSSQR